MDGPCQLHYVTKQEYDSISIALSGELLAFLNARLKKSRKSETSAVADGISGVKYGLRSCLRALKSRQLSLLLLFQSTFKPIPEDSLVFIAQYALSKGAVVLPFGSDCDALKVMDGKNSGRYSLLCSMGFTHDRQLPRSLLGSLLALEQYASNRGSLVNMLPCEYSTLLGQQHESLQTSEIYKNKKPLLNPIPPSSSAPTTKHPVHIVGDGCSAHGTKSSITSERKFKGKHHSMKSYRHHMQKCACLAKVSLRSKQKQKHSKEVILDCLKERLIGQGSSA